MPPAQDLTDVLLDGRYRLVRLMGEGGMGQVYEGFHEALDRKVAVKVLLPRYAYEPKFRERFLREAKAASKVRHPNVVHILDFGDTPSGSVYFAMEFLEGRDLAALLRTEGALPWRRAQGVLLQVASALTAAHERKIIHRDIKPANVFIEAGRNDPVKVLDFGIAKLVTGGGNEDSSLAQSLTGSGEVFGTAKYMAPEQAFGTSDDPRVDVYSLGIVAYEVLTGKVPFSGVSVFEVITRHVNELPRSPRELVPELPVEAEAWILRALAKRPEDRFASMERMEQELRSIPAELAGEPVAARPVTSWPVASSGSVMPALPVPAPAPMPMPMQAGAPVSEMLTTPSLAPFPAPGHAYDSATSVVPTRLKAPSPVTSGELMPHSASAAFVGHPSTSGATGGTASDDSGIGASTARQQGAGDDASATGPTHSRASGSGAADTDPHSRYTASRPTIASSKTGFVLGLLGTLGGAAAVLVGYLVVVLSEDDPPATTPPTTVVEPAKPEAGGDSVIQPSAEGKDGVVGGVATPSVPAEPTPGEPVVVPEQKASVEPVAPVPATPAASKPSRPREARPAKPPAPLTDNKVASQLARTLKKQCGSLGSGVAATVSVVVGSDGAVLSKSVRGASGELRQCLVNGVAKAKFPAGKTRTVPIAVSL
jgi:serine/threonine protein kinase